MTDPKQYQRDSRPEELSAGLSGSDQYLVEIRIRHEDAGDPEQTVWALIADYLRPPARGTSCFYCL